MKEFKGPKHQGGWAAVPYFITAIGALKQGQDAKNAADYNAGILRQEGRSAEQVSLVQEQTQRQQGREFLGRQAAAIGQSGVGYGGSSEGIMDQSAQNAELDALNVRYRGVLTKFGYGAQADNLVSEGNAAQSSWYLNAFSGLLAGGALLRAPPKSYAGN